MTFQPIDPIELIQLTEQVRVSGLRHDQARFLVHKLTITENERQRLQAQVDGASEHRRALRSMMVDESQQLRERLEAAQKRIAELEATAPTIEPVTGKNMSNVEKFIAISTLEEQRVVDERTRLMASEIVNGRKLQTLEEAKLFAQGWIECAAQYSRNEEYYKTKRDELEADVQRLRALIDGAHI
jgi:hypothetical protein